LAFKTCLLEMTPDQHLLLGAHPEAPQGHRRQWLLGHGFKLCSLVGEVVADLVESGTTAHNIDHLAPDRPFDLEHAN
jgi:sarcosine oxidase